MRRSAVRAAVATTCGAVVLALAATPADAATATLTPTYGPVGSTVTITGTGFTGAKDLTFNGVHAALATTSTDTEIDTAVPAGATTGEVLVTAADDSIIDAGLFTVQQPTSASITASTGLTVFPGTVTIRSVLHSGGATVSGQPARLQRLVIGSGNWDGIADLRSTSSTGVVSWTITPRRTYAYRVVYRSTPSYAATRSPRVAVAVRPTLALTAPSVAPILTKFRMAVTVRPTSATGPIYLDRRYSGAWHRVAKAVFVRPGHYTVATSLASTGTARFRLDRPQHAGLLAAVSAAHSIVGVNRTLRSGMSGSDVLALQRRLRTLHYDVGAVNGSFGYDTLHAVVAFQKVQGMTRDGVVGPAVWRRLTSPRVLHLLHPFSDRAGVEVDLTHQVVIYGVYGHVRRIIDASTGGGYTYTGSDGTTQQAITPTGHFSIVYKRDGWVTSSLGTLYRPAYFNYSGYAIHGEGEVPSYPASHGCVRITVPAMDRFNSKLVVGLSVWIYRV
ncbi:MAG TPA: L,D-transpeptidase family protein [Mycobacteriales bacterium]|nr:L,D-transpeptidase family protein [Mycobacteriales bacterium]